MSPFKSKSQVRAMAAKMNRGEISKKTFQHFVDVTKNIKSLPEKVKHKK